ncbi:MAG TPA: helix-turn-helix transcriptional regulator [Candidatus Alistipes faecavium]|uniref:helix-turn-helix transcriptional regulator n=1 Tax=uncultured Alistipes sp. TaxID=538949 RepID=UPI001F84A394|nr:helix-turn-helix transcriptional regulator [uncultured Alistipes sp.]HJA96807.1 helix-turn-helix transcriptional regulator [Candidatus Alistipes faecavium]
MYRTGGYTGDDRMCDLVCDRYAVLQVMSRFGIALGFGDKTIAEVCEENRVDAATFLAVVNMLMGLGVGADVSSEVSVRTLTDYLHNAHGYFLDFRLPAIRRKLIEAIDCSSSDVAFAILRFFDEYVAEVQRHMAYEEQTVFPYVESLLSGEKNTSYSMEIFRRQHDQVETKLRELKNIIIKYYPSGSTNELNGVLFDIFTCEQELASHNAVEDDIFVPAVERLASESPRAGRPEPLSAREREIIVCVVKGLTNKQIADALCISTHTVITHRRNIAAKLQIHSAAGLTIYAIVNNLVELSEIRETIHEPQP